jgi:hypothetical protein
MEINITQPFHRFMGYTLIYPFSQKAFCIVRESNPGRPRGRRAFYHWTNDAGFRNCSCGRVVKATDSKSVSLWERRFESYQLRHADFWTCSRSELRQVGLVPLTGHWFLDSLVVRISACHVEGPGSIPGRGEIFWTCLGRQIQNMLLQVRLELTTPA